MRTAKGMVGRGLAAGWRRRTTGVLLGAALVWGGLAPATGSAGPLAGALTDVMAPALTVAPAKATATKGAKKSTPKLTVTKTSKKTLKAGEMYSVQGKASASLRGKVVKLQVKSGSSWKTIGQATVSGEGRFTMKGMVPSVGKKVPVRVLAEATATTKRKAKAVGNLKVAVGSAKLAVTSVTRSLEVGDEFRVAGTASKLLAGKVVVLELDVENYWERLLTTRVTADGRFAFVLPTPSVVGKGQPIRVTVSKTATTAAAAVRAGTIDVAKASVALTATLSHKTANVGEPVTMKGTASKLLVDQMLFVEVYVDNVWSLVATTVVGSDGTWQATARFDVAGSSLPVRVAAWEQGTTKAVQVSAGTITITKAAVSLTVGSLPESAEVNQAVTVKGTASPSLIDQPVFVEAYADDRWSSVGVGIVRDDRTWQATARFDVAGASVPVRVVVHEYESTKAAQVSAGTISVYEWRYLSDLDPTYTSQYVWGYSARIGSSVYPASVIFDDYEVPDGYSQARVWRLDRECTVLDTAIGIETAASNKAITYDAQISTDDTSRWSSVITYATPQHVTLDITGATRLQFDVVYNGEDPDSDNGLVFGDPRVKCAP